MPEPAYGGPDDTGGPDNIIPLEPSNRGGHSRDIMESFIGDYNRMFNTRFTTKDSQSFYGYYKDLARRVKNREIDILLVVHMFLTGFDSPRLNTLYVDKNLKHHGLIQAYSRTNRIVNDKKSHGNIVCFRNLKHATDEAIALFANKEAREEIILAPYETYTADFDKAFHRLLTIAPTVDSVSQLENEEQELEFIKAFRDLMRLKNQLSSFVDFSWDHLQMDHQLFEDYKSKYLDLYEKVKGQREKEKVSILDDVDFELELIHRDEINVTYILTLLANLKDTAPEEREKKKKQVMELIAGQVNLRSKRELIEKFIEENLLKIQDRDDIPEHFSDFWNAEKERAFARVCREENLDPAKFRNLLSEYLYSQQMPISQNALETYLGPSPRLRERRPLAKRITDRLKDFVETFIDGIDE